METIAVTPEQGRQIVQYLDDLDRQLMECLRERYKLQQRDERRDDGFTPLPPWLIPRVIKEPDPEEIEFAKDHIRLRELSEQVEKQVEQKSHVEKQLLIEINEKLGKLQENYGNILIFSATAAAIISGLKDLIDLLLGE